MTIAQKIQLRCVLEQNKELVNYNGQISHLQTEHPLLVLHPHFISSLQAVAASEIVIIHSVPNPAHCLVQPHPSGEGIF